MKGKVEFLVKEGHFLPLLTQYSQFITDNGYPIIQIFRVGSQLHLLEWGALIKIVKLSPLLRLLSMLF